MKFAKHPIFQIDNLEWLEQSLTATPAPLEPIANTPKANATWEDRCACIGMMSKPAGALCSMLIWGNDNPKWRDEYDKIIDFLSTSLHQQMKKDKIKLPNNCKTTPAKISKQIAEMVFYLHFHDFWDYFTVKGRLQCGGIFGWGVIPIHERTYSNQMLKYQRFVIEKLQELAGEIEQHIFKYKKQLKTA